MAIPRNLANLANQLNTDGEAPKIEVGDSKVEVTDTGSNGTIVFNTDNAERMRIDSSGNVGIGSTSPSTFDDAGTGGRNVVIQSTGTGRGVLTFASQQTGGANEILGRINFIDSDSTNTSYRGAQIDGVLGADANSAFLRFSTANSGNPAERMRITSDGTLLVGKTVENSTSAGVVVEGTGTGIFVRDSEAPLVVNRLTNDGTLVSLRQASVEEGTISVSGNTVSYNAFTGGHWSQLQEGRGYNPDIPRGTVMSTIGDMCLWKSVEWTETIEHEATEEKEAWTETIPHRESYLGDLPVGATFEEDGFTKTIVDDGNERLPKVKISDVVGDKAVYGVFQTWDDVQDMLVTSLGAFVVRIAAGVTVEIGDLLESNGDGCAKVQDDDIIRSKTIAKVTSTTPTATYDDGSYTVPAVIYCG